MTARVPGIIEHPGDRPIREWSPEFFQELNDARAINVRFVRHGQDRMGDDMEIIQDVKALGLSQKVVI